MTTIDIDEFLADKRREEAAAGRAEELTIHTGPATERTDVLRVTGGTVRNRNQRGA